MDKYRMISMLTYGAAAVGGAVLMAATGFAAILAVAIPFGLAAAADRFVNRDAEPDERLRSFVIYVLGAVAGLMLILVLGTQFGQMSFILPIVGFALAAVIDYLKPPEAYSPNNKHRYGNESPPVTVR